MSSNNLQCVSIKLLRRRGLGFELRSIERGDKIALSFYIDKGIAISILEEI